MKSFHLDNMVNGWFLGNFIPTVTNWKKGEIAIKSYQTNHIESSYCHSDAYKIYVVLSGKIMINNNLLTKDSVALINPKEDMSLVSLTNSKVLLIIFGNTFEYTRAHISSLDNLLGIYKSAFPQAEYMSGKINFSDISVVVQGAIDHHITKICLESIRKFLPGCTIILSTWKGQQIEGLDYDEAILNDDPGAYVSFLENVGKMYTNNVNRQLESTKNGLNMVKTKYAFKLRSDMILTGNGFLNEYHKYPLYNNEYRIFMEKVIISDIYTRRTFTYYTKKGAHTIPHLFHVSDWFFFGLTQDLNTYFTETPLMCEDEATKYVVKHIERRKIDYIWNWRYTPEQYYAIMALRRKYPWVLFDDWADWNSININQADQFIANNFIVLDFTHHGITIPKYEMFIVSNYGENYTEKGLFTYEYFNKHYNTIIKKDDIHSTDIHN